MSIVIESIVSEEKEQVVARVKHGSVSLQLGISGKKSVLEAFIGKELPGSLSYEKVVSVTFLHNFLDKESGIFESNDTAEGKLLCGRVHSITKIDENESLIDLYLQTGPEFLLVSSKDFSKIPKVGQGVKLLLRGLCFHPSNLS